MKKLTTLLSVVLAVNLLGAPAAPKTPAVNTELQKEVTTESTETAPVVEENLFLPETLEGAPQVNPQPAPQPFAGETVAAPGATDPDAPVVTGTVDIRPSHYVDSLRTENYVDLGYKVKNHHFIVEQDFNTNLYNSRSTGFQGTDVEIRDLFFRYKFNNLWESEDKIYSLSYELRPYMPTWAARRDAGMVAIVRNYAKFSAKVSDSVTLGLWEIPIAHIFNRAAKNTGSSEPRNAAFENRVYLIADWNMTEKWSLSFPLMINSTLYRAIDNVDGGWGHYVWIYPELDYAIDSNFTVGLSWYNDESFFTPNLSDSDFDRAFKNGVAQFVFRATL